jgi:hypothetical protein
MTDFTSRTPSPSVAALATAKRLPAEFLRDLGLRDTARGVAIPYHDAAGNELFARERLTLTGKNETRQPKGVPLAAYGSERIDRANKTGVLFLVEGESDCWTLWYHDLPALGIPGANAAKVILPEHVEAVGAVYVVVEQRPDGAPDSGGEQFRRGAPERLSALGYKGRVYELRMPAPLKDVSDLHCADPDKFLMRFQGAVTAAPPLQAGLGGGGAAESPEDWPAPLPIGGAPDAPPFPVEVFPEPLQRFVREAAAALPCPPDYLAVPLLVIAGGVIGASRALAIKPGHVQRAALYAAVIGTPGAAKTPALEAVVDPVHEIDEEAHARWELAMEKYEADLKEHEAKAKDAKKNNERPPDKPAKPRLSRQTVDDATAESLAPILKENPRGVVMVADELIGWVGRMNCYREGGKGADRQFWLSAWSGKTTTIDRKKTHDLGPIRIHKPFIGVIGGLTPDKLPTLRGDRPRQRVEQDGFLDRLLLSYPAELPAAEENWRDISEDTSKQLADVFTKLRTLEMVPVQDGLVLHGRRPHLVKLSSAGKAVWQKFTRQLAAERNADDFPRHLAGPWAKFRGYCGRLALIVHFLRWACGEVGSDTADVDGESMKRAACLINYFKGHAAKVYGTIDADRRIDDARQVLRWLESHPEPAVFSRRDVHQGLRRNTRFEHPESLDESLKLLQEYGYLRAVRSTNAAHRGRPAAEKYERNPLWICPQYPQNPRNDVGGGNSGTAACSFEDFEDIEDIPEEENKRRSEESVGGQKGTNREGEALRRERGPGANGESPADPEDGGSWFAPGHEGFTTPFQDEK